MFIKDFTDEQYLEIQLTNPSKIFSNFMNLYDDERIVGWVSVETNENIYPGLTVDGKCFYQIVHAHPKYSNERHLLRNNVLSYLIDSIEKLDRITKGETVIFTNTIILNPENKNVH